MEIDELWPGGPKFIQSQDGFRLGTDSVLLSAFVGTSGVKLACDLGSGSGVISVILAWNNPSMKIDGIEIQQQSAELSRKNIELCGLSERVTITCADLRHHREFMRPGSYDLVVSNPPYFPSGSGKTVQAEPIATARDERCCTLEDICRAGAYLTKWGGKFAMVHRPERLAEVICAMSSAGLEPKRLRFVQHRQTSAPNLFLIEGRRGGKPSLTIEKPLIMTDENGHDSDEIINIYHRRAKP
jgi:tRNA1Val (adenine37-N6)-methyltransferase